MIAANGLGMSIGRAGPKDPLTGTPIWFASSHGCFSPGLYGGHFSKAINRLANKGGIGMSNYTDEEKTFLLRTARAMIASSLLPDVESPGTQERVFPALLKKRGCFVTLHKKGALRGCIGSIDAARTLIDCVKDNALNAAFGDPRFPSVTAAELPEIEIEISVLTSPETLPFTDANDLKQKLIPGVHGVILAHGRRSATFLPQVWAQLQDVESFLTQLCLKAGLSGKAWQDQETQIKVYQVEYFSE